MLAWQTQSKLLLFKIATVGKRSYIAWVCEQHQCNYFVNQFTAPPACFCTTDWISKPIKSIFSLAREAPVHTLRPFATTPSFFALRHIFYDSIYFSTNNHSLQVPPHAATHNDIFPLLNYMFESIAAISAAPTQHLEAESAPRLPGMGL